MGPYILVAPLALLLLLALLGTFISFDRLVRLQYDEYRSEWEKDGKPSGFFWRPPEWRSQGWLQALHSGLATHRVSFLWLIWTPAWMRETREGMTTARRMRVLALVWNVGIVVVLTLVVLTLTARSS